MSSDAPKLRVGATWVVNNVEGREYLGHVLQFKGVAGSPGEWLDTEDPKWAALVQQLEPGTLVRLSPCYILSIGEQMTPQGVAMGCLPIPYALLGFARPVTMRLGVVAFVGELEEGDLAMVKSWVGQAEGTRTQVRSQRIGLAVPKR